MRQTLITKETTTAFIYFILNEKKKFFVNKSKGTRTQMNDKDRKRRKKIN
jgi:hypothetical protein